jgi:putative effector of murein hydrolase
MVADRCKFNPLVNPVAIAVALLVTILTLTKTPCRTYFAGAQFVHFLLGPATVALAIPLYQQLAKLKRNWFVLLGSALLGGASAIATAMGVAEKIGGLPSLTAVLVMVTGIIGASTARWIFNLLKIDDHSIRDFALGVTSHGIGTAREFQVSEEMGAFSGLAMGLSGVLTALLLPLVLKLLDFFRGERDRPIPQPPSDSHFAFCL